MSTADQPAKPASFDPDQLPQLFGHPTGLYTLFFAEMWERFSYYGMRALLIFYMIKGFLYGDKDANAVYGAYTALVYMTPFFGGMIADRMLGARAAVVIGGILMAAGHLLMTIETELMFFTALGLLICGNGFFKPNISTIVGTLYPAGSPKRDSGFTIFYIGINLGAAMAPLLCGYIGETYGWHYGFGLATIGMLVGLAVFVAPTLLTQSLILLTALASAYALVVYNPGDIFTLGTNIAVAVALMVSGTAAVMALAKGGLPKEAGAPPVPAAFMGNLTRVLIGTAIALPVFVLLVSGFSVIPGMEMLTLIPEAWVEPLETSNSSLIRGLAEFVKEASRPAGLVLIVAGLGASIYLIREALGMEKIARQRMYVVFILTFFSLLFWAFFEQSGSSVNNFTDRNVDRVIETSSVSADQVGQMVELRIMADPTDEGLRELPFLSQEYLGQRNADPAQMNGLIEKAMRTVESQKEEAKRLSPEDLNATIAQVTSAERLSMSGLTYLREFAKSADAEAGDQTIEWTYDESGVGRIGLGGTEIPASVFQSVNPIYIMIFGLVFSALWGFLGSLGMEPSTPVKFAFGLIQLGLGFLCLWLGAVNADPDGMVAAFWILLLYLLMTTGELCLSPVGLSMVTKLSPGRLVSTVMGAWFLATAFSQFLAAIIAQFAAVNEGGGNFIPIPKETVMVYGDVYQMVAFLAIGSGVVCLILSPILKKWMHVNEKPSE